MNLKGFKTYYTLRLKTKTIREEKLTQAKRGLSNSNSILEIKIIQMYMYFSVITVIGAVIAVAIVVIGILITFKRKW